jgi:GNAT superfamily N-acetyltransferase
VRVLAGDGSLAARGQVASGDAAVVDQAVTDPAHRRRGLGAAVMRTLADTATDNHVSTGIRGATVEGRELYRSLGGTAHAPLPGFVYRPHRRKAPGARRECRPRSRC